MFIPDDFKIIFLPRSFLVYIKCKLQFKFIFKNVGIFLFFFI